MPSYKLHYFDARGRVEPGRLLFAAAGVPYEDIRFTEEEWPSKRPTYRFRQVPVLEIDGKQFGQSLAIFNYLAREFGFYGKTSLDILNIDMVVQIILELHQPADQIFLEQDATKKAALEKKLLEEQVPYHLAIFDKLLKENGTGYFVGSALSLADIMVFDFFNEVQRSDPKCLEKFPEVKRHAALILSNDRISNYIKNRRQTKY